MPESPVLLSAFADEGANHKTALEQMTVLAATGLKYYSPRFLDVEGNGEVKHVVDLDESELKRLARWHEEYQVRVASIGSRVAKVKLRDVDDGTHNKYVPIKEYLETEVDATIKAAHALETKLIRGFSFYHPRGEDPWQHVEQAVDQIGQIVDRCAKEGLVYGLEIEANLVGQTGPLMAELAQKVDHPNLVCIFDGGNVATQNKNPVECYEEYLAMRKHIGWMHIKDYAIDPDLVWTGAVDEERLKNFVPANVGDSGHELVLRDFRQHLSAVERNMKKLGAPGVFLEVEPHLKGGGQFGGFSGPDGLGVAVRALASVLDYVGIDYDLRDFEDIKTARGF